MGVKLRCNAQKQRFRNVNNKGEMMSSMKDSIIRDPDRTAIKKVDGKRVLMGYGNGSIFMATFPGFDIRYKLSKPEALIEEAKSDWKPLSSV